MLTLTKLVPVNLLGKQQSHLSANDPGVERLTVTSPDRIEKNLIDENSLKERKTIFDIGKATTIYRDLPIVRIVSQPYFPSEGQKKTMDSRTQVEYNGNIYEVPTRNLASLPKIDEDLLNETSQKPSVIVQDEQGNQSFLALDKALDRIAKGEVGLTEHNSLELQRLVGRMLGTRLAQQKAQAA